ncbi:MAG: peptidyl-prolyl cis-trans isomerase [Armatimonadota bacterium]
MTRCWLLIGLALFLTGCRSSERIIARTDGITVTAKELQESLWQRYGSSTLRELVQQKLLEREAQKRGIVVTDSEITQALKRYQLTDTQENRRKVRMELLLEKLANAMVEVTEAEAKQYYEQNKTLFRQPERVHLREITLESKENAEAIWEALRLRNGENFTDLARHFSINPATRQRGGDVGVIPVGDLHPKLQAVVKQLKVGEFSRPVEINGEWVILKLEARFPEEQKNFEQVREQIIAQLKQQKVWQLKLELPNKLLRQAKVQILDPTLKKDW